MQHKKMTEKYKSTHFNELPAAQNQAKNANRYLRWCIGFGYNKDLLAKKVYI